MSWTRFFRRRYWHDERARELDAYLEAETDDNIARGMSPGEARRAAHLKLGNTTRIREEIYNINSLGWLETLWQDLRFAGRMLVKNPGFTAVAVLTLALGIGANTAMFTVVNTVLLQPLPYPDSGHIVEIHRPNGGDSMPMFTYWERNNPGFEDLAAFGNPRNLTLSAGKTLQLVRAMKVSLNYFRLFGANPVLGRAFTPSEDRPGGPQVLVMSFGLWQQEFGSDPPIVGKAIGLGGVPYTVVGVLPPGFKSYPPSDVWIPLQADPASTAQEHVYEAVARLPRGMTLAEANFRMAVVGKRYGQAHPEQLGGDDKVVVTLMQEELTGDVRPALLILLGAVGLVLMIAWANLANLLLARGAGRRKEVAVRAAIGAGRWRIVRQLLTEALLLALAGGVLGLAVASWGVHALLALVPGGLPRIQEMAATPALDPWVAGFALLFSFITGAVFGLFPALQLSRPDLTCFLKDSIGGSGSDLRHGRTRGALIAGEVGIAVILLCGAMLLIRSFVELLRVDPGFDPHHVLTLGISMEDPKYTAANVVEGLSRQVVGRLESIPGVQAAAMANSLPSTGPTDMIFNIPGQPPQQGYRFIGDVLWQIVSPHYFAALRIPLRSGRLVTEHEPAHTVIINEAMARKFWPNQNPVGRVILLGAGLGPRFDRGATEVVGVVGNVRYGLGGGSAPAMYQTFSQVADENIALVNGLEPAGIVVRTEPGVRPSTLVKSVQQVLLAGDTPLLTTKAQTLEEAMRDSSPRTKFDLVLLALFAAIALLLATVGIYGLISYTVAQCTHEIGIRTALGAARADVVKLILEQGMVWILIGIATGIAGALALTRFLVSMLYGVRATDPFTFVGVPLLVFCVALLASYIPVRRATKIDPMVALRHE